MDLSGVLDIAWGPTWDLEFRNVSANVSCRACVFACVKLHIRVPTAAATFVIIPNRMPMFHILIAINTTATIAWSVACLSALLRFLSLVLLLL